MSSRFRRTVLLPALLLAAVAAAALVVAITRGDEAGKPTPTRILRGHKGGVLGLAFSPDGKTLAAASVAGTVRLWDTSTWRPTGDLRGRTTLLDLAFSPNGDTLVTAGQDGSVRLWDVESRTLTGRLRGHRGWVLDVTFTDDGSTLATAGDYYYGDGRIRLWDVARRKVKGPSFRADAVAMWFTREGRRLTFLNAIGQIKDYVIDQPPPPAPSFDTGANEYGNGAVSPDRSKLALVNEGGELRLWDVSRRPPQDLRLRRRTYQSWGADPVAFAPNGKIFASASTLKSTPTPQDAGTVVLWDVERRTLRGRPLQLHNGGVTGMAFSPDGATIAVGGDDGTVVLRRLTAG